MQGGSSHADLAVGRVLGRPFMDVRSLYSFGRVLRPDQFSCTYIVTDKSTSEALACKSIPSRLLRDRTGDAECFRREVQIMQHLAGQPRVAEFRGVYEDHRSVHLVMELCDGGGLFDRIFAMSDYTERIASRIFREMVSAGSECHAKGVILGHLTPESFLFLNECEFPSLKLVDFRLSEFFNPGDIYMAPEETKWRYGFEADIFSAGVILYILLTGVPPFWAENEEDVYADVLHDNVDFSSDSSKSLSRSAQDLLSKILHQNPKERLTAAEILVHPWFAKDYEAHARDWPLGVEVKEMKEFKRRNELSEISSKVKLFGLSGEDLMELNNIFSSILHEGVNIVQIVEQFNKPEISESHAYCGVCVNELAELPNQEIKICESDKGQQLTNADPPLDNQITCTRPKVTSATELDISFDDIGALGDIKEELLNLVMLPFWHPELHKGRLRTPCKGILLFGPPGCGKTMLAKAIAKETNASFINAFEDHDMSEWLGAEKSKMNELFRRSSELSPSILFLDNVDTALQTMKSEFVACLDKFMADERINQASLQLGCSNCLQIRAQNNGRVTRLGGQAAYTEGIAVKRRSS